MTQYQEIIYLQGHEAQEALEILKDHGEDEAIMYLTQWDYGDGAVTPDVGFGTADKEYQLGEYILSYNISLQTIGLIKKVEEIWDIM